MHHNGIDARDVSVANSPPAAATAAAAATLLALQHLERITSSDGTTYWAHDADDV